MVPRLLIRQALEASGAPSRLGAGIELDEGPSRYLKRVLRLEVGAPVQVFDGQGHRYLARIAQIDAKRCTITLESTLPSSPRSSLSVTLAQCLSSADKMDWTIEKAVELGVRRIVPLFSERSPVRFDAERGRRKLEHWQAVVEAACMQCGEDHLPELLEPRPLVDWLQEQQPSKLRLTLSPDATLSLPAAIAQAQISWSPQSVPQIDLLVGPESGLSDAEIDRSIRNGFQPVRLGPRVLRTETAGLAALAALMALAGDFQ